MEKPTDFICDQINKLADGVWFPDVTNIKFAIHAHTTTTHSLSCCGLRPPLRMLWWHLPKPWWRTKYVLNNWNKNLELNVLSINIGNDLLINLTFRNIVPAKTVRSNYVNVESLFGSRKVAALGQVGPVSWPSSGVHQIVLGIFFEQQSCQWTDLSKKHVQTIFMLI